MGKKQRSILYRIYLGHQIGESVYGVQKEARPIRRWQAQALGIADRNVGKVSGRAEFYQRLKALSVAPVKEPTCQYAALSLAL